MAAATQATAPREAQRENVRRNMVLLFAALCISVR
jgi:hypothetical protein